jgi:hypothetical protein
VRAPWPATSRPIRAMRWARPVGGPSSARPSSRRYGRRLKPAYAVRRAARRRPPSPRARGG